MVHPTLPLLDFQIPEELLTPPPTEVREVPRDAARLLVSRSGERRSAHHRLHQLPELLEPGTVVVINLSQTVAAAYDIQLPGGPGRLHLSPRRERNTYLLEVRRIAGNKTIRYGGLHRGQTLELPDASLQLRRPYEDGPLWLGNSSGNLLAGAPLPVQYDNLDRTYPLAYYQTPFATVPGSTEMPSAGRGLTRSLLKRLHRRGVRLVPVLLHTGLSSPERHEAPLPEYFEVGQFAAHTLNRARAEGRTIVAVGTTAVRATESAADDDGRVHATAGWTNLHLKAGTPLRVANGLLTGFHEPEASHLDMLSALVPPKELAGWYREALAGGYYWHEFGDVHLLLAS